MGKIFKSEEVVRISEAVKIPDCVIRVLPEKKERTVSEDNNKIILDEYSQENNSNTVSEQSISDSDQGNDPNGEMFRISENSSLSIEEERDRLFIEREAILKQAELEANTMLENARAESEKMLSDAKVQVDSIYEEARDQGYNEGVSQKKAELDECIEQLNSSMNELGKNQEDFFDECADQMKYLSIEIAEKIMAQKLEIDPQLIIPLVKSAVKSLRDVTWIKVEISDKLNKAVSSLEQSLSELKPDTSIEVESRRGSPIGTCVVHTAEGVTVASVLTQIENIHKYFSSYRDNDYDERESGSDKTQKESESK